jgi:transcriptional regulator with XRE-family HTH domain
MTIASRIRKIREVRGWKQTAIAASMNITQQAYSCLEQGASNARLETLKRFCDVMKIELPFLIAIDVPITEETIERYGNKSYYEFITTYRKLEQKVEIFEELLTGAEKQLNSNTTNTNMSANIRRA